MGAGKTSVGEALSEKLKMDFYDLDREVERSEGLSVEDIFKKEGERYFREKETAMLETLSEKKRPCVISTGGGTVLSSRNRDIMSASGEVFYLKVDIDILWERIRKERGRPLIEVENPYVEFRKLFLRRKDIYELSPHIVSAGNMNVREVADEVVNTLK